MGNTTHTHENSPVALIQALELYPLYVALETSLRLHGDLVSRVLDDDVHDLFTWSHILIIITTQKKKNKEKQHQSSPSVLYNTTQ